ncbi:MAG: ATP-dependent zinc protease family protein [Cellvibrionaceae bacterium]
MPYRSFLVCLLMLSLSGCLTYSPSNSKSTSEKAQPPADAEVGIEQQCPAVNKCPALVQCPPITEAVCAAALPDHKMTLIGQVEYVDIFPTGLRQKARIDTGAETSSIDARDITEFERDGKPWLQFSVIDRVSEEAIVFKLPIERTVLIKRHGADRTRRYVVSMTIAIGDLRDSVEMTLADREQFDYPVLIGRNFLQGQAIVDVSRKFIALEK